MKKVRDWKLPREIRADEKKDKKSKKKKERELRFCKVNNINIFHFC